MGGETKLFSTVLGFPAQAPPAPGTRTVLDWRGIPLAVPVRFDLTVPGLSIRVARRWREGPHPFLKLVHPEHGTTVDYAVRALVPAVGSTFAFLEIAPGCPEVGNAVAPWSAVEVVRPDLVRTLRLDQTKALATQIGAALRDKPTLAPDVAEARFGPMAQWANPDWGDPGNVHRVCLACLAPRAGDGPNIPLANVAWPILAVIHLVRLIQTFARRRGR